MPKLQTYKTSAVEFDGAMPLAISSGEMTYTTTSVYGIKHLIPWRCQIQKLWLNVRTTSTDTALFLDIGTMADIDANLDAYRVDASTAGLFVISLDTTVVTQWVTQTFAAGDVATISIQTGNTAVISVLMLLSPNVA